MKELLVLFLLRCCILSVSCGVVEVHAERTPEKCSPFLFFAGHVLLHHGDLQMTSSVVGNM